jgi:hypothetical protein
MASTPAMKVVETAPIPGVSTPSLPVGGLMSMGGPDLTSGIVSQLPFGQGAKPCSKLTAVKEGQGLPHFSVSGGEIVVET